jgi:transposase-like protein
MVRRKKEPNRVDEMLDELLLDCHGPEAILGESGLLQQLSKRLIERALSGELSHHLKHEPSQADSELSSPSEGSNSRNGYSKKTVQSRHGEIELSIPRDRNGDFEPILVGNKELLGLWIGEAESEGAKFWLKVLTELKNRGLKDILIACCDGLTGFPQAIESLYPQTQVQLCIVHLIRNCLRYVPWKDAKAVAADLKPIYQAATLEAAEMALDAFSAKWDDLYPAISQIWLRHWHNIIPIFDYPMEIRRVIYTTNAIESLNRSLRKVIKTKAVFPDEESVFKLMYLAMSNIAKRWNRPIKDWKAALSHFAILFPGRFAD